MDRRAPSLTALLLVLALLFTACGSGTPSAEDEYVAAMRNLGFDDMSRDELLSDGTAACQRIANAAPRSGNFNSGRRALTMVIMDGGDQAMSQLRLLTETLCPERAATLEGVLAEIEQAAAPTSTTLLPTTTTTESDDHSEADTAVAEDLWDALSVAWASEDVEAAQEVATEEVVSALFASGPPPYVSAVSCDAYRAPIGSVCVLLAGDGGMGLKFRKRSGTESEFYFYSAAFTDSYVPPDEPFHGLQTRCAWCSASPSESPGFEQNFDAALLDPPPSPQDRDDIQAILADTGLAGLSNVVGATDTTGDDRADLVFVETLRISDGTSHDAIQAIEGEPAIIELNEIGGLQVWWSLSIRRSIVCLAREGEPDQLAVLESNEAASDARARTQAVATIYDWVDGQLVESSATQITWNPTTMGGLRCPWYG